MHFQTRNKIPEKFYCVPADRKVCATLCSVEVHYYYILLYPVRVHLVQCAHWSTWLHVFRRYSVQCSRQVPIGIKGTNIDQSEEGEGLSYANEDQGLQTKSDDTTRNSVCQSIEKLLEITGTVNY